MFCDRLVFLHGPVSVLRGPPASAARRICAPLVLLLLLLLAAPAAAQQGSASGEVVGRVFDSESGSPLEGVTVILVWPPPADGSEPRREVAATDAEGAFGFAAIPAGSYRLDFARSGYRKSSIANLVVEPGERKRADFPLPPLPPETAAQILELDEFVVEASTVDEMMASLELRMDSDQLVNVMSAEDLSRFAATDVGDALKRVAGVNIVEGQFAIIRGLEDRYSSTLYNSAVVPSPDPDRQSIPLDLFPAEVVDNLVVSKTFGPELPGNSAAGSIDIVTHGYPEEFTFALKGAGGFNDNAVFDGFLEYESGSPVGEKFDGFGPVASEGGAFLGGRWTWRERELRYKALVNWERDYETREGYQEGREPRIGWLPGEPPPLFPPSQPQSGGLSSGELALSSGRFDLTESEEATQGTAHLGLGIDLDREGLQKLDGSVFYTKKKDETVQLRENGTLPNFDYGALAAIDAGRGEIRPEFYRNFATIGAWITGRPDRGEPPSRGPLWFTSFSESRSFERERDLLVAQLNGDHRIEPLDGLHVAWAANYARTTQDETAQGVRYFFEPDDRFQPAPTSFPVPVDALGPGRYASRPGIVASSNEIEEKQGFGRLDADYERGLSEVVGLELRSGGWYEYATRSVSSDFLESPSVSAIPCARSPNCTGSFSQFSILGDTPQQLGAALFGELNAGAGGKPSGTRFTSNESNREVWAWHVGGKATFWENLEVLGGIRLESIFIESLNEPFTGENRFGVPDVFPTRYVFWDRVDNPVHRIGNLNFPETSTANLPGADAIFNDEILGLDVPIDGSTTVCDPAGASRGCVDLLSRSDVERFVNGEIDERKLLPSAAIAYRPLAGLALRAAWSKTVARPSFREMGFYVSVEPGTDDLVVGNPQLGLSEVESWDGRVEYTWGSHGDLVAASGFYKTIENPIESIVVRNPLNLDITSSALFRTFFNNPDDATLWGVEAEARKNLGFVGLDFAEYFTIGGNFTWIEAEVDRTAAELLRSQAFFGTLPGESAEYSSLEKSRRLFGQPQWIANADLSFDQPDWGTRATLAVFAISDVLDAAGSASVGPDGSVYAFTIDRYIDSYYQLDFILSQTWSFEFLRGDLTLKFSAKNLTNTTRRIIYDPAQTSEEIPERSYKKGRDYKLSLTVTF